MYLETLTFMMSDAYFSFFLGGFWNYRVVAGFKNMMYKHPKRNVNKTVPKQNKAFLVLAPEDLGLPKDLLTNPNAPGHKELVNLPGGQALSTKNYLSFWNDYKSGMVTKPGCVQIREVKFECQMSGQAHVPTWECKGRLQIAEDHYKTLSRSTNKKEAMQMAASNLIAPLLFRTQRALVPVKSPKTMTPKQFEVFWDSVKHRFTQLSIMHPEQTGMVDLFLGMQSRELYRYVCETYQAEDISGPGGIKDLTLDGDVEENPGPLTDEEIAQIHIWNQIRPNAPQFPPIRERRNCPYRPQNHVPFVRQTMPQHGKPYIYTLETHHSMNIPLHKLDVNLEVPDCWEQESDWERDLTEEGIEPNPGPLTKAQFLQKHAKKYATLTKQEKEQRWLNYNKATVGTQPKKRKNQPRRVRKIQTDGGPFNSNARQVAMDQINMPTRQPRGNRMANMSVCMSDCAKNYAVALVNPFSYLDYTDIAANSVLGLDLNNMEPPCIPSFPSLKSRRLRCFIRGTMTVGTAGNMQLVLAPRRLANNYPIISNYSPPLIISTGATDPGTTFPTLDTGAGLAPGFTGVNTNSDFTTAESDLNTTMRLVGAGIRIRYAGPDINRSGIIHAAYTPGHQSLSDFSLNEISQFETYFRLPVSKKWSMLTYTPTLPDEYQYDTDLGTGTGEGGNTVYPNYHYMGFLVTGAAPGTLFEYETVHLLEVVGPTVRDLKPAESDIRGLEMVNNVVRPETQMALNLQGPRQVLSGILKGASMLTAIAGASSGATKIATGYALTQASKAVPMIMGM